MPPPQKGKVGTKGSKQIVEENAATLSLYRNMALASTAVSMLMLFFYNTTTNIVLFGFAGIVFLAAYQFMAFMSKARYTESGQILDSGSDLNMEGGIGEHVKDIIILTTGCQLLSSLISNYFWLLWLLAPMRGFWLLWKNVLAPYFFQPAPVEPEANEKKQKKMERRMRRQH